MKTAIGLLLSLIITGSVFATGISVNFDGAKVVYIDQNNVLNKIDDHGNVSFVLSTNVGVSYIHFSEQGNLFVVFQSKQRFSDGYDYLLARAVPTNNTISGIDTNLSSITLDSSGLCPGVQSDSSENLYYLAGNGILNKCVGANGTNIVNLINDNISIDEWLVRSDGIILMGGSTASTDVNWLRKLTPDNNLSSLAVGASVQFLLDFPDDRVYAGIWGSTPYYGVFKLPVALTTIDAYTPYIAGNMGVGATPEYAVDSMTNGHNSTYTEGLRGWFGSIIEKCIKTDNGRTIVLAGSGSSKTVVQYYPTPEIIEPTLIDSPTLIEKISNLLLIAGTKNGVNKLILYDPATSNDISLLNEDIEVYHLTSLYDGYVWLDGLKFNGNQYVVGKIQITNSPALRGALHGAATSVGSFQEMATLSGKPADLVGVVACPILAPTSVNASDGTYTDKVRVTWSASTDATSYLILRYTNSSSGLASQIGTSTATTYDDTTATPGTPYYYWVRATDGSNVSSFSSSDMGYCRAQAPNDYDGDGKSDLAVYRDGYWSIYLMTGSVLLDNDGVWGGADCIPVPGDYDGDGKADLAFYRDGYWSIYSLANGLILNNGGAWGGADCIPVPGDYDGDGKSDLAFYRDGYWSIYSLANGLILNNGGAWGGADCIPVPGDYDGDGKADLAFYRDGYWSIYSLANGLILNNDGVYGGPGWTPVSGDYDGDGKSDRAVYRDGDWYIYSVTGSLIRHAVCGGAGWIPVTVNVQ
ncbi:MAG: VCBS repeat-containing protein [Verrucomicrobia bacterium]|nr:VCBS repeat-containing protein [Verrucomicrobiota bacterium]